LLIGFYAGRQHFQAVHIGGQGAGYGAYFGSATLADHSGAEGGIGIFDEFDVRMPFKKC
jgi:hypothetical protein